MGTLRNATTGLVLAERVEPVRGILARYVGFLTRASIAPDEGLWFADEHAVHTIGMRARLDVLFLDADGRVLHSEAGVGPGRLSVSHRGAAAVLEMGAGFLERSAVVAGDRLALEP